MTFTDLIPVRTVNLRTPRLIATRAHSTRARCQSDYMRLTPANSFGYTPAKSTAKKAVAGCGSPKARGAEPHPARFAAFLFQVTSYGGPNGRAQALPVTLRVPRSSTPVRAAAQCGSWSAVVHLARLDCHRKAKTCEGAAAMNRTGNIKHGQHGTRTYRRWKSMRQRAAKATGPYATVDCCARWESFEAFLSDMGECPEGHTLDRIDNQRGYEPANCRWATVAAQNFNRSAVVMLSHAGACKSVADWARDLGVSANTIRQRLYLGWDATRALTTPVTKRGSK